MGRPSLAAQIVLSPGERNPIEGKFGQVKTGYGLTVSRLDVDYQYLFSAQPSQIGWGDTPLSNTYDIREFIKNDNARN